MLLHSLQGSVGAPPMGNMGRSLAYGATIRRGYSMMVVFIGEVVTFYNDLYFYISQSTEK
jgi:hypothetical protein